MAESKKIRILMLRDILLTQTDENHSLTREQIIAMLAEENIKVERKTLYDDIQLLRKNGLDIIQEQKGRTVQYYIGQREFELTEIKLLVDLVQSSKFITSKKSQKLIKKLESLTSKYEAAELHRQVYVTGRNKTDNELIYYNVDKIHSAINQNKKIAFQYFQWNVKKEKELRHNGKQYVVSPWALLWDNEKYYLIAFDKESDEIRHYRVDKILYPELYEEEREGMKAYKEYDIASYTKKVFGMFDGDECTVKLRASNSLVGVLIDRFGLDIEINPVNDKQFDVCVTVELSDQFMGWILALGNEIEIVEPDIVRKKMKTMLEDRRRIYTN